MSIIYQFALDGAQVQTPTGSEAFGTGYGIFDTTAETFTYSLTVSGLDFGTKLPGFLSERATPETTDDVLNAHIHDGARGGQGGVAFGFLDDDNLTASLNPDGSWTMSGVWDSGEGIAAYVTDLGTTTPGTDVDLYFNIHTTAFGSGEIRGQIVASADDNANTITGTVGNDTLFGLGGDDTITGLAGNDYLDGGEDNDSLSGGAGDDEIDGRTGNDTISGGEGNDNLAGDEGDDSLSGGEGDDTLIGNDGADTLIGGAGNDTINGLDGADSMVGGLGDDVLVVDNAGDTVTEDADAGQDTVAQYTDTLTLGDNFEDLILLGATAHTGVGNDLDNSITESRTPAESTVALTLRGLGGNDYLGGGAVNDTLEGGDGDDRLDGMAGADSMVGGLGDDLFTLSEAGDVVVENAGEGNDTVSAPFDVDLQTFTAEIENFSLAPAGSDDVNGTGDAGDNEGVGSAGSNVLTGFGGNDTLLGKAGDDTLDGGDGDDSLVGDEGADSIVGGADNDRAYGGDGVDKIEGGDGNDWLRGNADDDSLTGGAGVDSLSGDEGADTLEGGGDDDSLFGGDGADSLSGGSGNDLLAGDLGVDAANLGFTGDDTLDGGEGDDSLAGGNGNDSLTGGTGDDTLDGGAGVDVAVFAVASTDITVARADTGLRITSADGDDLVLTGMETLAFTDQTLSYTEVEALIPIPDTRSNLFALDESQVTTATGSTATGTGYGLFSPDFGQMSYSLTVSGLDFGEVLENFEAGTAETTDDVTAAHIHSGARGANGGVAFNILTDDNLSAAMNPDGSWTLRGTWSRSEGIGPFEDALGLTEPGEDLDLYVNIHTAAFGSGEIRGQLVSAADSTDNTVTGTSGNDTIHGLDGEDTLNGGDGDDSLIGNLGDDSMTGGAGDDTYDVGEDGDVVVEQADEGTDVVRSRAQSHTLAANVEDLQLVSATSDTGIGNDLDNKIFGNLVPNADLGKMLSGLGGNDSLFGDVSDDTLSGGAGDDSLIAGRGDDSIEGGDGDDLALLSAVSTEITVAAVEGGVVVTSVDGQDTVTMDVENIRFTDQTLTYAEVAALSPVPETRASLIVLDEAQVTTPTGSTATGTGYALFDADTGAMSYAMTVTGLDFGGVFGLEQTAATTDDVTAMHIHLGARGANGGVAFNILTDEDLTQALNDDGSWTLSGIWDSSDGIDTFAETLGLTPAGEDLELYVNIHTTAFGSGEIRGQIVSTADAGANAIDGSDGNDTILGLGGDDTLSGAAGNDDLRGGDGVDSMIGGLGDDIFHVRQAGDSVAEQAGEGSDQILGFLAAHTLPDHVENLLLAGATSAGGTGNDLGNEIDGSTAANEDVAKTLSGLGGDDVLSGGLADDTLDGGAGDDALFGGGGQDVVRGGEGTDTAHISANRADADVAVTEDAIEISVAGQTSRFSEVEFFEFTDGRVSAGDLSVPPIVPTTGPDLLVGTEEGESIDALAGNDTVKGLGGNDTLVGGDGDDSLDGGAGDDQIAGQGGNDSVFGREGDDALSGGLGADLIEGGLGRDTLNGGGGADRMLGGQNGDFYFVNDPGDVVVELATDIGIDRVASGVSFDLGSQHIETLILGGSADSDGTGNDLANYLLGNGGNNVIRGEGGNDRIEAGAGEDTLFGGAGDDTLNGGPGSDEIHVDDLGDQVAESSRWEGVDTVISSVDFRMGRAHIENLDLIGTARLGAGNGLKNIITGNDSDNILDGGKNVDTLIGGLGDDIYLLRAPGDNAVEAVDGGIDTVRAFRTVALDDNVENLYIQTLRNAAGEGVPGVNGIGNDLGNTIVGNPFDNVISGGGGKDTLKGQGGADSFVFNTALDPDNVDRIIDFGDGDDQLVLQNSIFRGVVRGALDADALHFGSAATGAEDRFVFNAATKELFFDIDGVGGAAQELVTTINLFDGATLSSGDFLIV